MQHSPLNKTDKKLLSAIQANAALTAQELGDTLNLSASQAGRRKQRLESEGVILGYQAKLNPLTLDLAVQALIQVEMQLHASDQAEAFRAMVLTTPQITSAWTLTGDADYLLRLYCKDLAELNFIIHDVLLVHPNVARVKSQIVMDQFKQDAPLPL